MKLFYCLPVDEHRYTTQLVNFKLIVKSEWFTQSGCFVISALKRINNNNWFNFRQEDQLVYDECINISLEREQAFTFDTMQD